MAQEPPCPFCGSYKWSDRKKTEQYEYKNHHFALEDIEYGECEICGADAVLPKHSKLNSPRIRDEHRKIDSLLVGKEIQAIRKKLDLTQEEAGLRIGGGVNAFGKYERGEVTQSHAMDLLLRILNAVPEAMKVLSSLEIKEILKEVQAPAAPALISHSNRVTSAAVVEPVIENDEYARPFEQFHIAA